jgi:acyl carrier protein
MHDTETRVIEIVAQTLSKANAKLSATTHFVNDLGVDSLDAIEVWMAIEDAFFVELPDEVIERLSTLGDVVAFLQRKPAAA